MLLTAASAYLLSPELRAYQHSTLGLVTTELSFFILILLPYSINMHIVNCMSLEATSRLQCCPGHYSMQLKSFGKKLEKAVYPFLSLFFMPWLCLHHRCCDCSCTKIAIACKHCRHVQIPHSPFWCTFVLPRATVFHLEYATCEAQIIKSQGTESSKSTECILRHRGGWSNYKDSDLISKIVATHALMCSV